MVKYTIDRFEGDIAVLLLRSNEEEQVDVPREQLPKQVKEGDILEVKFSADGSVENASILEKETEDIKKQASDLLQKLINKNKS